MDWLAIGGLIAQYGLPFVEQLITNWTNNTPVTVAEWNTLKALAQNTALSQMQAALARAGIPLTDPHALALLAQVPGYVAPATSPVPTPPASPPQPA